MGFSKGNEEKNIVITDSEKKKLDRDKANAIQEKKRVEVKTSQLKIEQEKVKESLKNELDAVISELKRASDIRAPFAHPARGGTHDELLEFRKLLFGSDKEEDGLLYKIIKYRDI